MPYNSTTSKRTKVCKRLKQLFALADLHERRHYFSYSDSVSLLDQSSELSEQLKRKLEQAEQAKLRSRESLKQAQGQLNQYNQLLASLKSSHQAKLETVQEFKQELQEYGVTPDLGAVERAEIRKMNCMNVYILRVNVRVNLNEPLRRPRWK